MIQVTILKSDIQEIKGTSAKTGKPYHLRKQTGYAHTIDRDGAVAEIPEKFEFFLEDGQEPYTRGKYTLSPTAVYVDRDGRLNITPRLVPVNKADGK